MEKKRLGILLSTRPEHPNMRTTLRLAAAARSKQDDVYLYLIDDGVYALDHQELIKMGRQGVKLFACAYAAQRRGIPLSDQANFCGLVVFSDLMKGCDRFIALN